MAITNFVHKIIPSTILFVALISMSVVAPFPMGSTFLWWGIMFLIIISFAWGARYLYPYDGSRHDLSIVKWYLIWNVFNILRGPFYAEVYWDWKSLIANGLVLLIPLVVYVAIHRDTLQLLLSFYLRYTLPLIVFVLLLFEARGPLGIFLMPMSFLILFFPALAKGPKALVLFFTLVGLLCDITTRSFLFKFGVPMFLMFSLYYLRHFVLMVKAMKVIRLLFLLAPLILFSLAVSGVFNVFKISEYLGKDEMKVSRISSDGEVEEEDLTVDTRTFLYIENLESAKKYNSWIMGRSPARGHDTKWFAHMDVSNRGERKKDEAAVLNIFMWTGIVGLLFYFLIFFKASYLAIYKSNNTYVKIIGLVVAFRWAYAWVEDINNFDLSYFTLWIMIGVCFSKSFRKMSDHDIKIWSRGIFDMKYRVLSKNRKKRLA